MEDAVPFRVIPSRDRLLNRLVKRAAPVEIARGDAVVRTGEDATAAVLVREGHLLAMTPTEGGPHAPERAADLLLPWELGGTDAVVGGSVHAVGLVAPVPATVQLLDGRGVRRVLRRAEGTFDAWRAGERRRLELLRRLGPGASTSAAVRLALVLVHLAERARPEKGPLELPVRVTHRVLGEMAGIHRSTVTTLINDWLYRDILETLEAGWRLTDPGALLGPDGSALTA